ncbi:tRNA threonylcarbamoyladenosine biosynthesis protein TsaE [Mucilaginibacter gracilis]|uniref:tRNA threonylcarbamoyladenosine biosynthesis protein TsaE n=1 Tax=Mucilaginibacter gracilis TaxID=423350 RepID=A0A495IY46_9SPHI|nr:tRNA (adenosine(37)-N6)-threonylcarbamoyltransferase complex ATPase subunit type 1 TsaE [Mucilaginibacter gracilis]RKR81291.1 tRNA threonylcarbamoyladenosine biosynthesis protein TsaE [Mucilaginibacter gracilis]
MIIEVNSIDYLPQAAAKIISQAANSKIFLFNGEMGAGKTTLIKALCKVLGVNDNVTSPTFSIVNEYKIPAGKIYHFDFYRLKNQTEALDMGCEEYFYSGDYCFIEWPAMIPDLIPDKYIDINIKVLPDDTREIYLNTSL